MGHRCLGPRRQTSRRRGGEWGRACCPEEAGGWEGRQRSLLSHGQGPQRPGLHREANRSQSGQGLGREPIPCSPRAWPPHEGWQGDQTAGFKSASQSRQTMTAQPSAAPATTKGLGWGSFFQPSFYTVDFQLRSLGPARSRAIMLSCPPCFFPEPYLAAGPPCLTLPVTCNRVHECLLWGRGLLPGHRNESLVSRRGTFQVSLLPRKNTQLPMA